MVNAYKASQANKFFALAHALAHDLHLFHQDRTYDLTLRDILDSPIIDQSLYNIVTNYELLAPQDLLHQLSTLLEYPDFITEHPFFCFQIASNLGLEANLLRLFFKNAIKYHPQIPALLEIIQSPLDIFGYQRYAHRFQLLRRLRKQTDISSLNELFFTPHLEVSIGHFHLMSDVLYLLKKNELPIPNVTMFSAFPSPNECLLFLSQKYNFSFNFFGYRDILNYPLSFIVYKLSMANSYLPLLLPPYSYYSHNNTQIYATSSSKIVVIHLRTHHYKNDLGSHHASIRNVDPTTYSDAIDYINKLGFTSVLITADESPIYERLNAKILRVSNPFTQRTQYQLLEQAAFIIGTCSGISALNTIGNSHILITNATSLWCHQSLSEHHLFALKNFDFSNIFSTSMQQRVTALVEPWEGPNGLSSQCTLSDLSSLEILDAVKEYLSPSSHRQQFSLHNLFMNCGYKYYQQFYPERILTSHSYNLACKYLLAHPPMAA